jgi:hypothetical protein
MDFETACLVVNKENERALANERQLVDWRNKTNLWSSQYQPLNSDCPF